MKYYPNIVFRLFVLFYVLAIIATVFISFLSIFISGLGMNANYTREVTIGLLFPATGIILFLFCSAFILFMQQYKNNRLGYLMLILTPLDLYVVYKIFSSFPFWGFIVWAFQNSSFGSGIFWSIIVFLIIIVAAIPFYVLIRLIKEDFFKKPKIVD